MKSFLLILFFSLTAFAETSPVEQHSFVSPEKIQLSRSDLIIGEHMVNLIKLTQKGYVSQDVLTKILKETRHSHNFPMFVPWLESVLTISKLNDHKELISYCRQYVERKQQLTLERVLERVAGNYCRERALQAIGRDIEKNHALNEESSNFLQEHLKYFLTKKNRKDFAVFLQLQASQPEVLKKISQTVTAYSVQNQIVPSHDVLKDIVINEQITKLIQEKGFNPLQHQNVFYAEYGKLIEMGYRAIDNKPTEDKITEHYKFLKNYIDLNQDHLPVGLCLSRLNDFAKAVFRAGFKDLSRDIFKFIVKKNNKEIQEDALFFYMWTWLSTNDWRESLKLADSYNLLKKPKEISDPRLRFWIAYSLEETGKQKEAIDLYESIITKSPLSYYSIMASKKVTALSPESKLAKFYGERSTRSPALDVKKIELDADHISSLIRLRAWAKIDNQRMMELELKRLNRYSMPLYVVKHPTDKQALVKSELHLINGRIIQESQNYLATFRYLYEVLDKNEVVFNRELLEILYPAPYLSELRKALKNDTLDPLVVLSLIRQESVFNPQARSPVGARGLMQIMPTTARRMKRTVRDKHLVNPELNIELGTRYFKNLLKRYDGNLVYVLGAYNAGEARVERWKNLYFDTDQTILKNIEAIPFLETRNYVKLIFRNIFFYKILLEGDKPQLADVKEANKLFDVHLGFNK
ncbi:MAG: transglycosylase SLT domain-containing protein [Bacteriovoracaceae bacterium]